MYVASRLSRRAPAAAILALAALAAAGCGGGGGASSATQVASGPGFAFDAPAGRELVKTPRAVTVLPSELGASELVSVTRFPLVKAFRPSLWPKARVELDRVAERVAFGVRGEPTRPPKTVRVAGLPGRSYEIAFDEGGTQIVQRITLLLDRRTEYQLLCRWGAADGEPPACGLLERTFRLTR